MATLLEDVERDKLRYFTDRDTELNLFDNMIQEGNLSRLRVIGLHGGPGVGKTELITYYKSRCRERGTPYISIDGYGKKDAISIVKRVRKQAGHYASGSYFVHFDQAVNLYTLIQRQLRDEKEFVLGMQKALRAEGTYEPLSILSGSQTEASRGLLTDSFSSQDIDSYLNAETYLLELLLEALAHACRTRWVFFVDAYEVMQDRDDWVRDELVLKLPNVFRVVIGGRNAYNPNWHRILASGFRSIELAPFDSNFSRQYLKKRGIHEEDLIDVIYELTDGRPLLLGMSADKNEAGTIALPEENRALLLVKKDIIRTLVERVDREHSSIIDLCGILRYFDETALSKYVRVDDPLEVVETLRSRYSFIKRRSYGFALHDWVWEYLNERKRNEDPALFKKLNLRAIDYYAARLENLAPEERDEWQRYVIEILFHRLVIDTDKGLRFLLSIYSFAESQFRLDLCESLLREASNHFVDSVWIQLLEARLSDARDDWEQSKEIYSSILEKQPSSGEALAFAIRGLGKVHYRLGEVANAERLYKKALQLYRVMGSDLNTAQTLMGLATVKMARREWNAARRYLEEAIVYLNRLSISTSDSDTLGVTAKQASIEMAWAFLKLGVVFFEQSRFAEALDYYGKSLAFFKDLDDRNGSARLLYRIGWALQQQGNWDEAIEYYRQSRAQLESLGARYWIARVIVKLAEVYRLTGRLGESEQIYLECMRICIQLDAPLGIPVVLDNLGCLYQDRGLLAKAKKVHLKSLTRKERNAFPFEIELTYLNLGDLYVKLGEYEKAEIYYRKSLSVARQAHNRQLEALLLVRMCGLVTQDDEIDPSVDALLKRALSLSRRHKFYDIEARVHLLRGDWFVYRGNPDSALKEYIGAIRYAYRFNQYLLKEIAASIFSRGESGLPEFQLSILQGVINNYSSSI